MAADDDLYDEEYDFVDDDEDENNESEADEAAGGNAFEAAESVDTDDADVAVRDEALDEYDRPEPLADHVVHIYEYKKYTRTIDRAFTAEDAEAFASEYNRTAKPYSRFAIAGKEEAKPKKSLN